MFWEASQGSESIDHRQEREQLGYGGLGYGYSGAGYIESGVRQAECHFVHAPTDRVQASHCQDYFMQFGLPMQMAAMA